MYLFFQKSPPHPRQLRTTLTFLRLRFAWIYMFVFSFARTRTRTSGFQHPFRESHPVRACLRLAHRDVLRYADKPARDAGL